MRLKLAPGLAVRESPIDGKGCFATAFFPKGKKITEYTGELISRREVARRVKTRRKHRICPINYSGHLVGARGGNATHYMNTSSPPTSSLRATPGHTLFR